MSTAQQMTAAPRPEARPGKIVIYNDVACAWSTVTIVRLLRVRTELGLDRRIRLDHRCFLLEDPSVIPQLLERAASGHTQA
jgi:predicted DsbA family dithiol-disulfide isomerase